jgi:amidase
MPAAPSLAKRIAEYFCLSGSSHTNATGPVHNPHKHGYSAGGSSSGSAVLVARAEADMALGGDQGGSIPMPASFCGIYGMKPTNGLVPYTGIMPIEIYVDHTAPMMRTVADNALLLEAIAGPDRYDRRQHNVMVHPYAGMLGGGIKGLKIGGVTEGFAQPNARPMSTPRYAPPRHGWKRSVPPLPKCPSQCTSSARRSGCRSASRD